VGIPAAADARAAAGEMVVMARVAGPFAVKGWIKLQVFTERADSLLDYPVWWIGRDGGWQPAEVEQGAAHGAALVAKLKGIDDREQAAALRGREVAVPREELPRNQEGEYYWADLEGLRVRNLEGEALGTVSGLLETGANQVLVLQGERERLIPFVDAVVKSVDLAQGELVVDWGADF
jgi:16S rRNA processing protein RimM